MRTMRIERTWLALGALLCAALTGSIARAGEAPPAGGLGKYVYPLAPGLARAPAVEIDVSGAPEAKAWAEEARKVVRDWFPVVWRLLATEGKTPPKTITLRFRKKINAPAYASGNAITASAEWIAGHPDDFGMMVHELTHLVQGYGGRGERPGWLVEGIADYIRWWRYEPEAPRTPINPDTASYRDSYRTTGSFLAFLTGRHDRRIVYRLDKALRGGTYSDAIFTETTGKDLDALWAEFLQNLGRMGLRDERRTVSGNIAR